MCSNCLNIFKINHLAVSTVYYSPALAGRGRQKCIKKSFSTPVLFITINGCYQCLLMHHIFFLNVIRRANEVNQWRRGCNGVSSERPCLLCGNRRFTIAGIAGLDWLESPELCCMSDVRVECACDGCDVLMCDCAELSSEVGSVMPPVGESTPGWTLCVWGEREGIGDGDEVWEVE